MTVKDAERFLTRIDDHAYWKETRIKKDAPVVAAIVSALQEADYSYKRALELLRTCELVIQDIAKIK